MAINPVRQSLTQSCACKGVSAGAEHRDKNRSRRRLASGAVVDQYGVASPVHEHLLTGAVLLSQNHVLMPVPSLV
jgi:hypothetical protein